MYVRDTDIIVLRPGRRGREHAGERFEQGGAPENDLLPRGDELSLYRVVVPVRLPESIMAGMSGLPLHRIVETPAWQGFCPRRGSDLGGDTLHLVRNARIRHARPVERGTLIAVEDEAEDPPTAPDA